MARLLHTALGHLRQPRLRPQRHLRRDLHLAALAGLPRHAARHEGRGRHRLHHGRKPAHLPRLALLPARRRSPRARAGRSTPPPSSTTTIPGTRSCPPSPRYIAPHELPAAPGRARQPGRHPAAHRRRLGQLLAPRTTTVTGAMQTLITPELMSAILSAGYNVDFIDADAIDKVGLGTHQILVLPPTDRIPARHPRKDRGLGRQPAARSSPSAALPPLDPEGKTVARARPPLAAPSLRRPRSIADDALPTPSTRAAKPDFKLADADDATRNSDRLHPPQAPQRRHLLRRQHLATASSTPPPTFATATQFGEAVGSRHSGCHPRPPRRRSRSISLPTSRASSSSATRHPRRSRQLPKADGSSRSPARPQHRLEGHLPGTQQDRRPNPPSPTGPPTPPPSTTPARPSTPATSTSPPPRTAPIYLEVAGGKASPRRAELRRPEHAALGPDGLPNPLVTAHRPRHARLL